MKYTDSGHKTSRQRDIKLLRLNVLQEIFSTDMMLINYNRFSQISRLNSKKKFSFANRSYK